MSATPGKTQEINFYEVRAELSSGGEGNFYVVDLPGYGFARAPGPVRKAWKPLIESYLGGNPDLRGVIQLIDIRHDPTGDDLNMVENLAARELPTLFVLTKVDKLRNTQRAEHIRNVIRRLGIDEEQAVPFSALSGEGRDELLESVEALLNLEGADS